MKDEMLLFGHSGILAGIVKASDMMASRARFDNQRAGPPATIVSWIKSIDYRLVLVGSLLPDIIDKPVFLLFGGGNSLSGRDYAHTLVFNLALLIGGVVLVKYRKSWLLVISVSSFSHLVFDQMWASPVTLFWPFLGPLPRGEVDVWFSNIFEGLFSSSTVYLPEMAGLAILLIFALRVAKKRNIISFLRTGAIK